MIASDLKPCSRVGLDVTKRCNWKCKTCFYRHKKDFNTPYDASLDSLLSQARLGKEKGCDHVVLVGWGEPMLYPQIGELIQKIFEMEMTSSIITNGSLPVTEYEKLYSAGLDHLHISVHGFGKTLESIAGTSSSLNQEKLLVWLHNNKKKWRSNTTLQKENYKQLPEIASKCVNYSVSHFVMLGFLPHYEWSQDINKQKEVAVHPEELRRYIEAAADLLEKENTQFTIRYHPLCHLSEKYWKYVVNALYVVYDPWEWCYNNIFPKSGYYEIQKNAFKIANNVAIQGNPCSQCSVKIHCGAWNKVYANAFDGANLKAIKTGEVSEENRKHLNEFGHFFKQNLANSEKGFYLC